MQKVVENSVNYICKLGVLIYDWVKKFVDFEIETRLTGCLIQAKVSLRFNSQLNILRILDFHGNYIFIIWIVQIFLNYFWIEFFYTFWLAFLNKFIYQNIIIYINIKYFQ